MLRSEWKKLRKSSIWLPVCAAPLLAIAIGALMSRMDLDSESTEMTWNFLYGAIVQVYAMILLPMLAGILASLVCRTEHLSGGWKQLLALPVSRTAVYVAKFFYILLLLALIQLLVFIGVLLGGLVFLHLQTPIPWTTFIKGFIGGWIATIPLAALQLWISTWWKSFAAPFALNVVFTIPAMSIGSSHLYGPLYPWAQPMLAMLPSHAGISFATSETALTITVAGIVFMIGGWLHFVKRDIHASP